MALTISATEAARSFADVLTRVRHKGEEFIVERGGEPMCRISPVGPVTSSSAADLVRVLSDFSFPDAAYFRLLKELCETQDSVSMEDPWER